MHYKTLETAEKNKNRKSVFSLREWTEEGDGYRFPGAVDHFSERVHTVRLLTEVGAIALIGAGLIYALRERRMVEVSGNNQG